MFKILPRRPQSKYETPSELHLPPSLSLCPGSLGKRFPALLGASFLCFAILFRGPPKFSSLLHNSRDILPPGWPITTQISFASEPSLSPLTVLLLETIHLPAFCVLGVLGIWGSLASPFLLCWFPLAFFSSALFSSVAGTVCYRPLWLPQFHPSFLFWNDKDTQNILPAIFIFCNWNQKSRMRNYRSLIREARTSFNLENSHPNCDNPPPGAWLESWGICRKAKQTESVWNCVEYFSSGAVKCPKREQSAMCVHPQQEGEF